MESFDCSGLAIRSICEATGMDIRDWPRGLRHIRDLWDVAGERLTSNDVSRPTSLSKGDVLVFRRQYWVRGGMAEVAGHMAIISVITNDSELPQVVHTYPRTGMVEERPLRTLSTLMGRLALLDLLQFVRNNEVHSAVV